MDILETLTRDLTRVLDDLKRELAGIRTNRPSAALVEDLKVSYYNELLPLKQVASIGVTPPRDIVIQVWDVQAVAGVVKAIESSPLGLAATADGPVIRVRLPELSTERRDELSKFVKRVAEEHRIRLRQTRDEANKRIQKSSEEGTITEDQKFTLKESVQEEIDRVNADIDSLVEQKLKDIRT
ncbi:MAG: ribosome-recycling factor [Patescibacteria group bacterium]